MLIKVTDNGAEEGYSISKLKKDNPNVSFPADVINMPETLKKFKVFHCEDIYPKAYDAKFQNPGDYTFTKGKVYKRVFKGEWRPLEDIKENKAAQVKKEFLVACERPVIASDGVVWNGGYDSALMIKAACDFSEFAQSDVKLFDLANEDHVMSVAEGKRVASEIAAAYQAELDHKQSRMRAIAAAKTPEEVVGV